MCLNKKPIYLEIYNVAESRHCAVVYRHPDQFK